MNKAEYFILRCAVTTHQWLREVAYKFGLSHTEIETAANRLFQSGNIVARVFAHRYDPKGTPNIILTMPDIQAVLDAKLWASYELTSQGGAYWETIAHVDWNRYFQWDDYNNFVRNELFECELIGIDRQLMQQLLKIHCYLPGHAISIAGTEIWDILEPWEPTYWKILPRAYRIRYQARETVPSINPNTPPSWYEAYDRTQKWYSEIKKWYTDPPLEEESLNEGNYTNNYDIEPSETISNAAEYFLLKNVIERYGNYEQDFPGVALNCGFSHTEILIPAFSLFQKGYILAEIYDDISKVSDVKMTRYQIQTNLDGKLQCYYYLTPQGGAYWETLAHPNWNRYYTCSIVDIEKFTGYLDDEIYELEMICSDQQLIEQFLKINCYLNLPDVYVGTEVVWDVIEPWQATYWKTLPRGYRVSYQARRNNLMEDSNISLEEQAARSNAQQWFCEISKWYTNSEFD
jgi:hypothetical protein